jgi:hypothetical protein
VQTVAAFLPIVRLVPRLKNVPTALWKNVAVGL